MGGGGGDNTHPGICLQASAALKLFLGKAQFNWLVVKASTDALTTYMDPVRGRNPPPLPMDGLATIPPPAEPREEDPLLKLSGA